MFEHLLAKIATALNKAEIPYMVIGGQAVLLYGEPRLTKDIDITLGVDLDNLPKVIDMVKSIDLQPMVDAETFTRETMVFPCEDSTTTIRVDFIFSFSPYEQQAMGRVRKVKMEDTAVHFASVEDVIIHKIIAGRPRDLEDVRSVLLKNEAVHLDYIRKWLQEFSDSLNEPFHERFNEIRRIGEA